MPDVFVTRFNCDVTKRSALAGLGRSFSFAWLKTKPICASALPELGYGPASQLVPSADGSLVGLSPDKKALVVEMLKITSVSSCLQ